MIFRSDPQKPHLRSSKSPTRSSSTYSMNEKRVQLDHFSGVRVHGYSKCALRSWRLAHEVYSK
jgi:hypothetical protein